MVSRRPSGFRRLFWAALALWLTRRGEGAETELVWLGKVVPRRADGQ